MAYNEIHGMANLGTAHDMGIVERKPVFGGGGGGGANNKGTDQPEHPSSLISAFVILFLKKFHI